MQQITTEMSQKVVEKRQSNNTAMRATRIRQYSN